MIHEIGAEMQAQLTALGCPLPVVDGPEPTKTTTFGRERIVIEHDPKGDGFAPPRSQQKNPRVRSIRKIGALISIYAKDPRQSATHWEHRRRAEHALDLVQVALERSLYLRTNQLQITSGRFVPPEDLAHSEIAGGALYELRFNFERAVQVLTWSYGIAPQAALALISMEGAPTLTFTATGQTVTRSAGSWLTDGFAVGMSVNIRGAVNAANNVAPATVSAASASVLTLSGAALVNEGPTSGCSVRAGGIHSQTNVNQYNGPSTEVNETGCGA